MHKDRSVLTLARSLEQFEEDEYNFTNENEKTND